MNRRKENSYTHVFVFVVLLGVIIVAAAGLMTNKFYQYEGSVFVDAQVEPLLEGWEDEAGNEVTLPAKLSALAGEKTSISRSLTQKMIDKGWLLFRTDHSFVRVYADGEEIYTFGKKERILFGLTPGSGWQLISIKDCQAGQKLTVEVTCPYEKYSGRFQEIYSGEKAQITSFIFHKGLFLTLVSLIPILVGIGLLIFPILFTNSKKKLNYIFIAFAFWDIGVWGLTESRTTQLFFGRGNMFSTQIINFVCFFLMVPSMVMALQMMGFIRNRKIYRVMMYGDCGMILLIFLLQIINFVDFFETLPAVHIMMIANVIIFFLQFAKELDSGDVFKRNIGIIFFVTLLFAAVMDLADFYLWDYFGNGFFTRIDFIALMLTCGGAATKNGFTVYNENIEKQVYAKLAYSDTLTGLGNHRKFETDVERLKREANKATLLYADMNGLKQINDRHGHIKGDKALTLVSAEMKKCLGKQTDLYRMGGDEFCALCYNTSKDVVERNCRLVNEHLKTTREEFETEITIAYGVVEYNGNWGEDLTRKLDEADQEMYKNKKAVYAQQGLPRL